MSEETKTETSEPVGSTGLVRCACGIYLTPKQLRLHRDILQVCLASTLPSPKNEKKCPQYNPPVFPPNRH